jgi:hypothetical protein
VIEKSNQSKDVKVSEKDFTEAHDEDLENTKV